MICHFNFFLTEVPIIKKPVHCFAEQIISKIYAEPSGFLFWKMSMALNNKMVVCVIFYLSFKHEQ